MKCLERSKSIRFLGSCLSLATRNLPLCIINSAVCVCVYVFATHTSAVKCEYLGSDGLFMSRRIGIVETFGRSATRANSHKHITVQNAVRALETWIDRLPQLFFLLFIALMCRSVSFVDLGETEIKTKRKPDPFSLLKKKKPPSRLFLSTVALIFKTQHARREFPKVHPGKRIKRKDEARSENVNHCDTQ